MFSDESRQTDLVDRARKASADEEPIFALRQGEQPKVPPFYSALERAIEKVKLPKAPAAQWLATLKNIPGVKPEEMEWLGLGDWLKEQKGAVTREAVLDYVRANQIEVKEVEKADVQTPSGRIVTTARYGPGSGTGAPLPGGENYRELLLTLPPSPDTGEHVVAYNQSIYRSDHWDEPNVLAHIRFDDRTVDGKKTLHVAEIQSDWHQAGRKRGYQAPTVDAETRQRLIAERHALAATAVDAEQKINDKYEAEFKTLVAKGHITTSSFDQEKRTQFWSRMRADINADQTYTQAMERITEINDQLGEYTGRVPNAPFKTTWPELALKRMIRYAAENDYERLSWDTGETNAARYDLSKRIDKIDVAPRTDAGTKERTRVVQANMVGGRKLELGVDARGIVDNVSYGGGMPADQFVGKPLSDVFGKDVADKIMEKDRQTLSDLDLKVGAEGMRGFYDQILPAAVNKLVKKYGGKVEEAKITTREAIDQLPQIYENYKFAVEGKTPVHALDITPQLREAAVGEGFPLFARRTAGQAAKTSRGPQAAVRAGAMSVRSGRLEVVGPFTGEFAEHADQIAPLLRAELDRLGLKDIALNLADKLELWWKGERAGTADGIYFEKAISIALDADQKFKFLHHEALHALRKLGLFKDSEYQILATQSDRTWRKHFDIDKTYDRHSEDSKTEEGIAHAYAAWANGEMKVDGRIARLFKRIRDFFEALRNALRGLGFKSAEDIFRDIKEGKIGGRSAAGREGESPMFAMREDAPAEAWESRGLNDRIRDRIGAALDSKLVHKVIEEAQDLSHPVKLLQRDLELRRGYLPRGSNSGQMIPRKFEDPEDFYTRKRLYPGRVAAWDDQFNRQHLDPTISLLKSNGISRKEADDFLYALHAKERNEEMDKINPAVGGEGSGMSNQEAEKILAEAKRGEHAAAYDELRQKVGAIRNLILDVMERSGLEKPAVIAEWRTRYKDYVPLRGWEVEPDDAPPEFRGPGAGFNVRGKEVKQAFGRRSKADSPLVNLFDQAYRTFDRAERNRYLQSLYRAIDDLGENAEDIATLDRGKPRPEIDPRTGMVRSVETSNQYMNPKAVYLKFDGNPHFIVFRDQELAEAVKRMGPDGLGPAQGALILQNKLKAMWTHYSPEFLFRHFAFRYPIEGLHNALEFKDTGEFKVGRYVKEAFPLLGTASKAIFASRKGEISEDAEVAEMQKYWNEMQRGGGAMMFRNMRDIDLTGEHLETAMKNLSDSPIQNAKAKWRHGVEAMDMVTNALDNSIRLAVFAAACRQGRTIQQANFAARDATQDFQLKGRKANLIGLFFPFGNVAVQTGAQWLRRQARSKTLRRAALGLFAAGFATAAYNYLVGGDDTDGRPFFDKIPPWERGAQFIVYIPGVTDSKDRPQPFHFPLMWGMRLPFFIGTTVASGIFGQEPKAELAKLVLQELISTFTFFGEQHNLAATPVPETLRPMVEVASNQSWTGFPVHMDPTFQKDPNAYSGRETTGEGWKWGAETLSTMTGGSLAEQGYVDLYPEDIRTLLEPFIGTQLRFGANAVTTAESAFEGEWPEPSHVPLGRVVFGTDYDAADRAKDYELRDRQKHPWKH